MTFFLRFFKYILIIFNSLFAICGIILLALGGVILVNENKGLASFTEFSVGGFALAVGFLVFLIAFFGCFGALKENSCLLKTYAGILITLFILQVVLGALAFVELQNDDNKLDKKIREIVEDTFKNDQDAIDDIQQYFECCGVDGSSYWTDGGSDKVPDSCCDNNDCSVDANLYDRGCVSAFKELISRYVTVIGVIVIVFAVIELLGAAFAFVVARNILPERY